MGKTMYTGELWKGHCGFKEGNKLGTHWRGVSRSWNINKGSSFALALFGGQGGGKVSKDIGFR